MSPFGTGFSSPAHSDTRRSTPALPPGLPLPFGRLPPAPIDMHQDALPVMAELGRIKPSQVAKESPLATPVASAAATGVEIGGGSSSNSENQRPGAKSEQEARVVEESGAAEKERDSSAFPALPTPAKPAQVSTGSMKKSKKSKTSSQQAAASEVKPASNKEVPALSSEEAAKVEQDKSTVEEPKKIVKKGAPGKIDTGAAQAISLQSPSGGSTVSATPVQATKEGLTPMGSALQPPETPGQAENVSRKSTQPRTIRILGPQASESLSPAPSTQKSVKETGATSAISATTPGTPKSDTNDVLSMTDSMSRASSPPLASSRVGSAPVRTKTKSQQKKERQERAKALEEREKEDAEPTSVTAASAVAEAAAVQEPIVGRKKKTKAKKSAPAKSGASAAATAASTPVASRPTSPTPAVAEKTKQAEMAAATASAAPAAAKDEVEVVKEVQEEAKSKSESKAPEEPAPSSAESEAARRTFMAELVTFLEGQGEADKAAVADFFKPAMGMLNTRWHDGNLDPSVPPLAPQPPLTAEELAALDSGNAVRRSDAAGRAGSRLLVTPHTRKALRALSPELEDRVLALERNVRSAKGSLRYSHRARSEAARLASAAVEEMFKDAAAILTRPPTTASASAAAKRARALALHQSRATRAGKEQVSEHAAGKPGALAAAAQPAYGDDALAYLNKFILPLPTNRVAVHGAGAGAGAGKAGSGTQVNASTSINSGSSSSSINNNNNSSGEAANPMSAAIPRTYTTGDPTYSVSGVDLAASNASSSQDAGQGIPPAASQKSMQAVAAAAMALNASAASSSPGDLVASATAAAESLVHTLGEGKTVADIRREALGVAAAISQQAAAQAQKSPQPHNLGQPQGFPQSQAQLQQAQHYLSNLPPALHVTNSGLAFTRSVADAEQAMMAAKKEAEAYEKKLMGLVRRNRKAVGLQ